MEVLIDPERPGDFNQADGSGLRYWIPVQSTARRRESCKSLARPISTGPWIAIPSRLEASTRLLNSLYYKDSQRALPAGKNRRGTLVRLLYFPLIEVDSLSENLEPIVSTGWEGTSREQSETTLLEQDYDLVIDWQRTYPMVQHVFRTASSGPTSVRIGKKENKQPVNQLFG